MQMIVQVEVQKAEDGECAKNWVQFLHPPLRVHSPGLCEGSFALYFGGHNAAVSGGRMNMGFLLRVVCPFPLVYVGECHS